MATGFEFFERDLRLATANLEPDQINAALAKFARQELARAIAGGASTQYDRYVNGRLGAVEESVIAPGPIVYVFSNWPLVINASIQELKKRSPRRSGRYQASFVVAVNQSVTTNFSNIPADAEVIIFNRQPYTRKIETGANKTGRRHIDLTRVAMNRRFRGVFRFETRFLDVKGGLVAGVPYILKRSAGRRRDRQAGMPISYPSLVINAV